MAPLNAKQYPSKILLFGEYLVLHGGYALAIPYFDYALFLAPPNPYANKKFYHKFYKYLLSNTTLNNRISPQFIEDIERGLHFDSSIPVGYGLGSSGALTAAIYDIYILKKSETLSDIKHDLAEIESFFHDKSSGVDPLTSFIQKPILIENETIQLIENVSLKNFVLYDSQIKRNAKQAITHFNILRQNHSFRIGLEELTTLSNFMVSQWVQNKDIAEELKLYSEKQLLLFRDFIPESVQKDWKKGLESNSYYMKLCGAGMGGFYLKWNVE